MNHNSEFKNSASNGRGKPNRLTVILACVAGVLVILVGAMLLLLPGDEEIPVETAAPTTEATVPSETETVPATEEPTEPPETEPVMLANMAELYEQNQDVIGWIRIDGTPLDNAVAFVPEDPERYLRKDLNGKYSVAGVPFIDGKCSMDPESDNLIIYGHNMHSNGTMFHCLLEYANKEYWEEHPTIYFSTLYEERTYEVVAAFYDRVYYNYEDVFKFYNFVDAETEEDFNEAITYYKETAEYDTGITPEYGDRLLTLVTCSYHHKYGRFVVIGRLVVDEPAETVVAEGVG